MFSANYSIDRGWKPGLFAKLMYVQDHVYRYREEKKIAEIDMSLINLQLATHSYLNDATRFTLGASVDRFGLGNVIGDTSSYNLQPKTYFNLFSRIEHNSLNKIYFPTRGVNVGGGAKVLLTNWTTNPVFIGDFYLKQAMAISDRITYIYSLKSRLVFGSNESYFYHSFLGGVQQTDYFNNSIPFNGIRRMELNTSSVGVGRLEFRLKMWEKIFVSLSGDIGMYSNDNLFFTNQKTILGYGLNAAYNSVVGPLEFNLSFSGQDKEMLPYLSLGFWF
jgi:NTE family protein